MHVAKWKGNQTGQLLQHDNRGKDSQVRQYSNQNIDRDRTHLNYNLAPDRGREQDYLNSRISEIKHLNRADTVRMVSVAITLPQGCEHSRDFFECAYNALVDRYGGIDQRNVISSYVHMDERTPHMHFNFVPVIDRDGQERLCCKEVITRDDLKTLHRDVEREVNRQLRDRGREPVRLTNGKTREQERNLSAKEYKERARERESREQREHREPQKKLFGRDYKAAYEQECRDHERTRQELRNEREERQRERYARSDRIDRLERDLRAENQARCELLDRWNDPKACRDRARELERDHEHDREHGRERGK